MQKAVSLDTINHKPGFPEPIHEVLKNVATHRHPQH